MTQLTDRPYAGESDVEGVIDLLLATRSGKYLERYPTYWRLHLLLSSRLWEPERDARVWEDKDGRLVGFAFLSRRKREQTSSGLEWILHPSMRGTDLRDQMLAWTQARTRELAEERHEAFSLGLAIYEDEIEASTLLADNDFALIQDAHNWYMACPLDPPLPEPVLPEGFSIRSVREDELEVYQAVYGFAPVSQHMRQELLSSPEYSHQVVVAPDGAFVAYCEASMWRKEWEAGGRCVGWIDYVHTLEKYQHRGLGKAILLAGLQQLRAWGADRALLVTMSSNTPAQNTFKSADFDYNERDLCYTKTITDAMREL